VILNIRTIYEYRSKYVVTTVVPRRRMTCLRYLFYVILFTFTWYELYSILQLCPSLLNKVILTFARRQML